MNDAKTIGSNALVLDTAEENVTVMNAEESKLGKEVSLIEQRAEAVVVASGADFEDAGLFLKQIKQAQKQVKDYWEPLRVSAKKSYDEVLNHRKEMIEPLEKAEKIVKTKVNEYSAEQEHKRRPRYKGTHPRTFQEKYKEHDPENYRSDVEKIIESGKTPAGMHIPILVDEILEVLQIQPGQTGYDATLGYGGHTRRMLAQLQGQGHLYATDVDPIEMEKTRARLASAGFGPELLTIQHRNFADVDQVAPGVLFDFVLADLGVSSMQIDDPTRGFTFKQDGPLDLRLDPSSGVTAAERLRQLDQEELENLLVENSDEPYADRIAKAVIQVFRRGGTVDTTRQLYALIEGALSFLPAGERKEAVKKSCQRTFQALRIDVNSEFEVLYAFLEKLPHVLKPGGRAAILTFHSGEDRLVKQAFRQQYRDGLYSDIAQEVTRPSPQECRRNPRAHSTKLRWAVRAE